MTKPLAHLLIINNPDFDIKQILQFFELKKTLEVVNLRELGLCFQNIISGVGISS